MRTPEEIAGNRLCAKYGNGWCSWGELCNCRQMLAAIATAQREAIEEAAKVADEIDKGIYKPGTIATAIRALLPPAPPSREDK